jgi:soluble lytic murein transglycosylase-like protein
VANLATLNGIDPGAPLLAGSTLSVPGTAGASPNVPPYPTPERVTASQVGQVAVANGVPASLAAAIGWQESGFNNDFVSSSDARGVMQILPSTWVWIQSTMTAGVPLAPASAIDNLRGGVLLLHSLLVATGGDPALAAAGYYQGLSSVRQYGMFPSTQQYVNDVMALRQRFGGP